VTVDCRSLLKYTVLQEWLECTLVQERPKMQQWLCITLVQEWPGMQRWSRIVLVQELPKWCGVKNTFGMMVYSKIYSFSILFVSRSTIWSSSSELEDKLSSQLLHKEARSYKTGLAASETALLVTGKCLYRFSLLLTVFSCVPPSIRSLILREEYKLRDVWEKSAEEDIWA
jgi:hypothetical protein